jgi:thiosulfate/3-mercaptopyruvate sulfurtransferase
MQFSTLISVTDLHRLISSGADALLIDCSYDLSDTEKGKRDYAEEHLPGARYVHLHADLSGKTTGTNGRHPLPDRDVFAARMREFGLHQGQQVVAYDSAGNFYAARLWWMLRWIGHEAVAVLDGGKAAWVAAGLPLESGELAEGPPGDFTAAPSLVSEPARTEDVMANLGAGQFQVLDARDPARFAGGPDALDPVWGHIPGARNRPFRDNLTSEGHFRPAGELATEFRELLGSKPAILQCGSGVTACHNALAMEIAGIRDARLYPGSWSEWISDPARPVATGEE